MGHGKQQLIVPLTDGTGAQKRPGRSERVSKVLSMILACRYSSYILQCCQSLTTPGTVECKTPALPLCFPPLYRGRQPIVLAEEGELV